MTEASCIAFLTNPSEISLLDNHTSVGTLLPHLSAKVVDDTLQCQPPGSPGELLVSGDSVFQRYYENATKTDETLIQDSERRIWLRTGDLVRIDDDGQCTILGRVKDMIKRGKSKL